MYTTGLQTFRHSNAGVGILKVYYEIMMVYYIKKRKPDSQMQKSSTKFTTA